MDLRKITCDNKKNVFYVNEDYFKNWTAEMAYVLGFFAADGCLTVNRQRGNKYIEFVSTDLEIMEKIKFALRSSHKISSRKRGQNWLVSYRLQIGSKVIYDSLVDLGFIPNKSKVLDFPEVPQAFLPHFIRGYFDGDGHCSFVVYQKKDRPRPARIVFSGFTSGSEKFLRELQSILKKYAGITGGSLHFGSNSYRLTFGIANSRKLFNFMYSDSESSIYLLRKFIKFRDILDKWGRSSVG